MGMGALALVTLVLSSCTGSAEEEPSEPTTGTAAQTAAPPGEPAEAEVATSTPEPPPPPPEPVWTFDGTILSNPVAHDGDLLLHVDPEGGEAMALVSLDAATGEENWRRPVGHSGLFSAGPPSLRDDLVYVFEDTGQDDQAFVVALDAVTGDEVARSDQELRGYQLPRACGESEVCLGYRLPGADEVSSGHLAREGDVLRLVEGQPLGSGEQDAPDGTSGEEAEDGEDVEALPEVDIDRDWETGEERIEGRRGDEVVWSVSVDEVGVRADPEHAGVAGWSQDVGGVYLHDTYYGPELGTSEAQAFPLEDHVLLALDREDGTELWRREGASLCATVGPDAAVVVVCSGEGELRSDGFEDTSVDADRVQLTGVAVRSGEQVWSHEITDADWSARYGDLPVALDEEQSLVTVDGDRVAVELTTGELIPAADARVVEGFACWWAVPWDAPTNLEDGSERQSERFWFPCDAQGDQVPVPTEEGVETFAETVGEARLVVGPDRVTAYPG
ncbi:hypothetical protein SGUI_0604 [Serinicoccus hydrothermalis]|uniref:Pyrrolo-quinoline quinone repeat domain-containing protein n=1 Tax=Serinicoccus hydrothermalis TaxID=1758689 RepID=A0A1B1N980_9MICO|nr:hypothetical protein SGUI_0604 [Serinicoccus hydrothermalis]